MRKFLSLPESPHILVKKVFLFGRRFTWLGIFMRRIRRDLHQLLEVSVREAEVGAVLVPQFTKHGG